MRKICLSFIFITAYCVCYGQKLTLSSELTTFTDDPAVPEIAKVWEQYINSLQSGDPDSIRTDLWLDGAKDIIRYSSYNSLLYDEGKQFTFSVRKLNDDIYEINTISWFRIPEDKDPVINCIYKVCAVKSDGQYKLLNYFDVKKHSLHKHVAGCIEYFYPAGIDFKKKDAAKASRFIRDFKNRYGITDNSAITYIVANNIDECSSILGFTYTEFRSEKTYAGRAIYPRILLSARPDHIHELVHAVMLPLYPEAPAVLHEGIATYYGGGANKSYEFHASNLRKYLSENKLDLTEEVYMQLEGETQLLNTLGALIIEYTLRNYSTEKVSDFFESKTYEDIFYKLGVSKEGINDFVYNKLIHAE